MINYLPDILSQHAEEAAILWLIRDGAVRAPHYLLGDLKTLDQRVEAHLEGLRIAGEVGWEVCLGALERGDPGEVFAAAVLAFESGREERIGAVLKAGCVNRDRVRGLASALGWFPFYQAERWIMRLADSDLPGLRRAALAASAIHRQNPNKIVTQALSDSDPLVRARAFRALGELGLVEEGRIGFQTPLPSNLSPGRRGQGEGESESYPKGNEMEEVRFWSAWSAGLLCGDEEALGVLQAFSENPDEGWVKCESPPRCLRAVQLVGRRLDPAAAKVWQQRLARKPELLRLAVIAAGVIGDPELVSWLIEQMNYPPVARVAGEAFSMITGVHISYDKLEGEKPEGFEAGPTEDPHDDHVTPDPDEHLYWPDLAAVQKWWTVRGSQFAPGTRYLMGKPMTPDWLGEVLRKGYQRQRAAAALELAIRQPGSPLFEVRAPGFRQLKILNQSEWP